MTYFIKDNLIFSILFLSIPPIIWTIIKISKAFDDAFGKGSIAQQIPNYLDKLKIDKPFSNFLISAIYLSDIIYGKKIISIRAFFASSLVTFLFFLIFCIILTINNPESWLSISTLKFFVWQKFSYLIIFGVLIDYISISITRFIFNWYSEKSIILQILSVIIDLIISITIFSLLYSIYELAIVNNQLNEHESLLNFIINNIITWFEYPAELSIYMITLEDWYIKPDGKIIGGNSEIIYAFPEGILFFSSLFTSAFGITFLIASMLYNSTSLLDKVKKFLLNQSAPDKPIYCATLILLLTVFFPVWVLAISLVVVYNLLWS